MTITHIDEDLKTWATLRQREYIDAINLHGSATKAAKILGVDPDTVSDSIRSLKRKAAMAGHGRPTSNDDPIPGPYVLRGRSTLFGKDGKVKLEWVKTKLDETKSREAIEEWINWLVKDAKGLAPPSNSPAHCNADLLTVYPMGDPHFGMYAWKKETGNDFDLDIAERLTYSAIDRLVASAPPSKTGLILELGDFFHSDNNSARTERSGNALDVDTRWARVMQVGLRAMVYVIRKALEKHEDVVVRIVAGNHDPHSSFALALGLDAYFHAETRVKVDLSPAPYWYYKFGKVLIGSTHGDLCKPDRLPAIMATDRSRDWGDTEFRYFYHGHIHHDSVKEFPGCMIESFRTLAAKDAWHTGAGYRAGRDMRCIIHHKDFGEIERHRCDIAMIS